MRIALTRDIAACLALRRTVFIDEQGVSEAEEVDGLDGDCLHLLATVDDRPVGTARLKFLDTELKIGRVCVLPAHRGTGLGAALIRAALAAGQAREGIRTARLGAQIHALEFYEKLGFRGIGPIYDDAGIDHRDMVADL